MADLSQYSDEQLMDMQKSMSAPQADLSKMSTEQLVQMKNQMLPENERPVESDNQGSHSTFSAPSYNFNPFTALVRGVNSGSANIQDMNENLVTRFLGASQEEGKKSKDSVNKTIWKPETIKPSMPGTGASIAENLGSEVVESLPAVAASSVVGPSAGWALANGLQGFAQFKSPVETASDMAKGAFMGKALTLSGKAGSSLINPLNRFLPGQVSKDFVKTAGSALGGGAAGAVVSGGDPSAIIQGAGLGAVFPQEPLKKSDIIPKSIGDPMAYALMKGYMKPWAKDFKYLHDPIRGWLNEGLTANSADQAADVAGKRLQEIGQNIGDTIDNSSVGNQTSDYSGVLKPLHDKIAQLNKSPKSNAATITRIQNAIDDINGTLAKSGTDLTPREAFDLKQQVSDLTKWTGNAGDDRPVNSALQDSYRVIRDSLNTQIPELKSFNQRYSDLSEAVKRLQYRADASNPMLKGISIVKDLGVAGLLGHGNPVATAAILAAEQAGKTAAVKTRLSNLLYDKPEFPGVPAAQSGTPSNPIYIPPAGLNPTHQGLPNYAKPVPLGIPNIFSDRGNTPFAPNVIRQGVENAPGVIIGGRPEAQYTPGPEAIFNDKPYIPGPESITTPKPAETKAKVTPEAKAEAQKQINDVWAKGMGINLPSTVKKVGLGVGAAVLGAGAFGGQAQAGQNIDIKKINHIESSSDATKIGDGGKAFGLNQIHEGTLKDYNAAHGEKLTTKDLMDGPTNDKVADWYYNTAAPKFLKANKIPDSVANRISFYNEGPGNFKKRMKSGGKMPSITKNYIRKYGAK